MLTALTRIRENKKDLYLGLITCGVVLLASFLRIYHLGAESVWIDEAYSINLSQHSIAQIIQGTAADQHPPLYYILLHYWQMLGNSITHARLLSAILGIILVIQVMILGRKMKDVRLSVGAALLLAISPLGVWYSQEARQYMLLACLTTASTTVLWDCLQGRKRWLLLWLFSTLAIYTQYFAIFIFLAQAIIVIFWSTQKTRTRSIIPMILTFLGVGLAFSPWIPTAVNQFMYHTMPWITEPVVRQVRDIFLILLLGNGVQIIPTGLTWLLFIGLSGFFVWAIFTLITKFPIMRETTIFMGVWALIPFLTISIVAIFYPVFQLKQYLIVLAPMLLLSTRMVLLLPRQWGSIIFLGLIFAGGLTTVYQQNTLTKDDWRGVALYVEQNTLPGDIIYANPAAAKLALDLYWKSSVPFEGYPPEYDILKGGWIGKPLTTAIATEQLQNLETHYQRVWLVEFFPEFWDANHEISSWLSSHGSLVTDKSFGKIHLRLFELKP